MACSGMTVPLAMYLETTYRPERVADYLGMGVEVVWLIDPQRRQGFVVDRLGMRETLELTVPASEIRVSLAKVFAELDELEGLMGEEG